MATTDLYVSWSDYHRTIEKLARLVWQSGWQFNQVVCIARGGLRVGDTLSRIFKLPLAIISTHSYTGEAGTERGELTVAKHLTMTTPALGDRILLVDDLVDSGITLDVVMKHLRKEYPAVREIRTAVLWHKACSSFEPDYKVDFLPDNPWIHQPFEPYDVMPVESLGGRG
jgi:hypoxanthine phosphoribosyltransferase